MDKKTLLSFWINRYNNDLIDILNILKEQKSKNSMERYLFQEIWRSKQSIIKIIKSENYINN